LAVVVRILLDGLVVKGVLMVAVVSHEKRKDSVFPASPVFLLQSVAEDLQLFLVLLRHV